MFLNIKKVVRFFKFYKGPYFFWDKAKINSFGYNSQKILKYIYQKAKEAKKSGLFEKDGFIEKKFFINVNLKKIITNSTKNKINILDFGGGFATLYLQFKKYNKKFNWHIVEQIKVCLLAKTFLSKEKNLFYHSNLKKLKNKNIDIAIFSSSIQYVKNYFNIISKVKTLNPKYIIFLKTPINKIPFDLVFVQKIPQNLYKGSYPSWVFSLKSINDILKSNYTLIIKKKVEPKLFFSNHYDLFYKLTY